MVENKIKRYFDTIRSNGEYDPKFTEILKKSWSENEEGEVTAQKILDQIEHRYIESKKHKA